MSPPSPSSIPASEAASDSLPFTFNPSLSSPSPSAFTPVPSFTLTPQHYLTLLAQLQSILPPIPSMMSPLSTVSEDVSEPMDSADVKRESGEQEENENVSSARALQNRNSISPSSTASSPRKKSDIDKRSIEYLDRRRKNNDSARRSRELRRIREQENRTRTKVLETENAQLRTKLTATRLELQQLKLLLSSLHLTSE